MRPHDVSCYVVLNTRGTPALWCVQTPFRKTRVFENFVESRPAMLADQRKRFPSKRVPKTPLSGQIQTRRRGRERKRERRRTRLIRAIHRTIIMVLCTYLFVFRRNNTVNHCLELKCYFLFAVVLCKHCPLNNTPPRPRYYYNTSI